MTPEIGQEISPLFAVGIIVAILFIAAMIFFTIFGAVAKYNRNRRSPLMKVPARVVAKRSDVSRAGGGYNGMTGYGYNNAVRTDYFVTFEMQSGERREVGVSGQKYGLLAEGDRGVLTYQGTWFKGFARTAS